MDALLATHPRRVAVFRALQLGDMLCAVPALRALKAGWPDSELSLIGLPWAREWSCRVPYVDRFIAFPGYPGLPETVPDGCAWPDFLAWVRRCRFDLLLQMHGSGEIVNPMLRDWNARLTVGFALSTTQPGGPDWPVRWPRNGHEIERLLQLVAAVGIPARGKALEFPLTSADYAAARALLGPTRPFACVHAGAQLPSRRWPAARFAAIGDLLARRGLQVVLTGSAAEAGLLRLVQDAMLAPALNLAGRTDLWSLGALIDAAQVLVCNDTGVSHIAAARGCSSVVISCGAEVARWAPLDKARHRVLWQAMDCRPCAYRECPLGHGCATAIDIASVAAEVEMALARAPRPKAWEERNERNGD